MISYDKLWHTMEIRGFSQYKLVNTYGISKGQIDRLRHNQPVTTATLDNLCRILECDLEDIAQYIEDADSRIEN